MADAQLNATPVLRPPSQLSFRLSQRPPATQRISRRQTSLTESIEDDSLSECADFDLAIDDFDTDENSQCCASNEAVGLTPANSAPLTMSSPALSLGSMASTGQQPLYAHRRVPLTPIQSSNRRSPAGSPLRKITECGSLKPLHTPNAPLSPRRPLSSPRPQATPTKRPCILPMSAPRESVPLSVATSRAYAMMPPLSQSCEPTPTKRPRRLGPAAADFSRAASQEVSEFCMWSHCLNSGGSSSGESGALLVCQQPRPSLRLQICSIERVLGTHLFSANANVLHAFADCDAPLLSKGQSISLLLSFAVGLDATPQDAQKALQRVAALQQASTTSNPAAVVIYPPYRIR
ncbi:hypothetical protein H4S01_006239, partial [Coemansia sp. RSA 2610]